MTEHYFVSRDMRYTYLDLLSEAIKYGQFNAARDQPTRELFDVTIRLEDPSRAVPYAVGRRLHMPIASAEYVQLVGGYSDLHQLAAITPRFREFADGDRLQGAYGPRLFDQWPHVITKLQEDRDTRQAVVNLWRPDELLDGSRDVPCTLSLGFFIRNNQLHMKTNMRSNDLWTGLPYDFAVFTALQRTLAWVLNLDPGGYTHHVWSLHLYERDARVASELHVQDDITYRDSMPPLCYGPDEVMSADSSITRWRKISKIAHMIGFRGEAYQAGENHVDVFTFKHHDRLKPYQPERNFCRRCRYTYDAEMFSCPEVHA